MSWIKRNLYFLVGGVVAVALLGLAGWYCYSKWQLNNENLTELDKAYENWKRIIGGPTNPGNEQVNNIEIAREQQKAVRAKVREVQKYFVPISPIPNPARGAVSKEDFYSALRSTILQLQKDAANSGVTLTQPGYYFSFEAEKRLFNLAPGSLGPLTVQLGEVKAICDVLFRAKINSLDNLQRERGASDEQGLQSDYLEPSLLPVTNDLAVLTPYVVQFHCFSAEVAGVLSGFGNDRHGFIVKAINVEPAGGGSSVDPLTGVAPVAPGTYEPMMGQRFGVAGNPGAAPTARGQQVVLDEKPLKVTLVLDVVKLLSKK